MSYFCVIHKGIIYSAGICSEPICRQLSELEYNAILSAIHNKPKAPEGYGYRLKENLEWELYVLPEPKATEEDYKSALNALGVNTDEKENA